MKAKGASETLAPSLSSFVVASLEDRATLQRSHHERDDCQNQEDNEQHLRDRGRSAGDAAETESCGDKRQNKKNERPSEHGSLLS
jgi:hypothetical protein